MPGPVVSELAGRGLAVATLDLLGAGDDPMPLAEVTTALQRRLGADNPDVDAMELDADHSPCLSRPAEFADALERIAGP